MMNDECGFSIENTLGKHIVIHHSTFIIQHSSLKRKT